jgi:hypothetical protein
LDDLPLEYLRLLAAAAARCEDKDLRERIWRALDLLLDGRRSIDLDAVLGTLRSPGLELRRAAVNTTSSVGH